METRVEAEVLQRDITQHKIGTHLTSAHFCMGTLLHRDTPERKMNTRNLNKVCPHVKFTNLCTYRIKIHSSKYCCISEIHNRFFHTVQFKNNNFIFSFFQNGSGNIESFLWTNVPVPAQIKTVYDHYSFSPAFHFKESVIWFVNLHSPFIECRIEFRIFKYYIIFLLFFSQLL